MVLFIIKIFYPIEGSIKMPMQGNQVQTNKMADFFDFNLKVNRQKCKPNNRNKKTTSLKVACKIDIK